MGKKRARKRIFIRLLALLPAILAAGCFRSSTGPSHIDIGDNNPDRIVGFGDSITFGRDSSIGGYTPVLQGIYAADGVYMEVVNEGISAQTTVEGIQRVEEVLMTWMPAAILILYGTNDQFHQFPKQKSLTYNNLLFMVQAARNNKTQPVLATMPPACESHDYMLDDIIEMNNLIRDLSQRERVPLAEVYRDFEENGGCDLINSGGVHPTDEGYMLIAQSFYEALGQVTW